MLILLLLLLLLLLSIGLALYDWDRVTEAIEEYIPVEKKALRQIESPECTLFGSEYGNLILEYMQNIVENRRKQRYLLVQV